MRKLLFILLTSLLFKQSIAQDFGSQLDPITVTSSFYETRASKTGRNITVITAKDIAQLPVRTPDELLRFLPGIDVQSRGAFGAQSDISMRGGTFQQVLVILDGLRLNDPNTGHFSGYIPVVLDEIEKIEILKGASSGIFGSDAVGGVIYITTKTFSQKKQTGNNGVVQLATGDLGLLSTSGYFSSNKNNQQFQVSALRNSADGPQQRGISGYMKEQAFSLAYSKKNKYWETAFRTAYNDREFAAQNFYTSFASDTAVERVKIFWNQFNAQYQKNKDQVIIYAGFKNTEDNYQFSSISSANSSFSNLFQLNSLYLRNQSDQTKYTIGAQYIGRNIRSNDRGNHTVQQFAVYGIWQQIFNKKLIANTSLRTEYASNGGWIFIPQMNLSYQLNQLQLRASAGYAYRNADFTELYNNYNRTGIRSGSIGNPNLNPEKSFNYEVGFDWITTADSKISFSAFSRNSRDLIDWTLTPYADMPRKENLVVAGNYLLAKNQSNIQVDGIEVDYLLDKKMNATNSIKIKSGFIWINTKNKNGPLSFYLSSAPKFLANFATTFSTKQIDFNLTGLYKSRNGQTANPILLPISNDYFVMNAKINFRFNKVKHIVFIQADNLFNSTINDFIGAPLPGRWLQAGARLFFN
ncbi:TonB-dependent siderophore receptor [Sediminibacterium sp.]|uniref:TonB-dependent receptor plug domain-containing protein n=1 Tax=Sediminibacterium sp. TaxID=1917865 RepID=UPI00273432E0|nr:TonB-dependent receptor [Sediminibacterium sp.]MDP3393924.1 TonB-dependent receptor [Sediminibacterium sp.]MDP3568745.1 TonB-dependent receptor [Sediminibacterium sp.]